MLLTLINKERQKRRGGKRMKKFCSLVLFVILFITFTEIVHAAPIVNLYVDSAPNTYGSPNWAPWWSQTKTDIVADSFTNLRTGTYPGSTDIDPYDEIVYSTGDLGKRLHWIYWIPGTTVAGLDGLFEVKWVIDWGGDAWTYEGGSWALDAPDTGWSQPNNWEDYDDGSNNGVIGSLGFAWWSTDNDAPPFDSGGSAYDEVDQADIDALRDLVFNNQTYAHGMVRIWDDTSKNWVVTSLEVNVKSIPEPSIAILLLTFFVGLVCVDHRRLF